MICSLVSGEFIEAVWLTRNGDSSPFSPDLHCDECLPPLFITSTTYCKVAIVPSTMVHTASPIATLNELNVGSSLFPDVIYFIAMHACALPNQGARSHTGYCLICLVISCKQSVAIDLSGQTDAHSVSHERLCVGAATAPGIVRQAGIRSNTASLPKSARLTATTRQVRFGSNPEVQTETLPDCLHFLAD